MCQQSTCLRPASLSEPTPKPTLRLLGVRVRRMLAFRSAVSELLSVVVRSFSTNSRPALRAAACGGRPRPARHDGHRGSRPHRSLTWNGSVSASSTSCSSATDRTAEGHQRQGWELSPVRTRLAPLTSNHG
jgi:hypothetical protein